MDPTQAQLDFLLHKIRNMQKLGDQMAAELGQHALSQQWETLDDPDMDAAEVSAYAQVRAAGEKLRDIVASFKIAPPAMTQAVALWDAAVGAGSTRIPKMMCKALGHMPGGLHKYVLDTSPPKCGYCSAVLA